MDGKVTLWNLELGQRMAVLGEDADIPRCVSLSPDGRSIAAGYHSGLVRIWRAPTFAEIDEREKAKTVIAGPSRQP